MVTSKQTDAKISYLVCRLAKYMVIDPYWFGVWSKVIWGQQKSKYGHLVNMVTRERNSVDTSWSVCRLAIGSTWSKVIWVQQRSKCKTLVNTVTSEQKSAETAYMVCGLVLQSTWSLLFWGSTRGYSRSTEAKVWKPCKYHNSWTKRCVDFILCMLAGHMEYIVPFVLGFSSLSPGVNRGLKTIYDTQELVNKKVHNCI